VTTLLGALALVVKHHRTITTDIVFGPGDVSTPVVNLVQSVVLGVSLLDLASCGTQEDQVNAITTAMVSALGDLKVTLPVNGEGVAAVGDGTLDESTGVVGLFNVAGNKLLQVLEDGRIVVVLGIFVNLLGRGSPPDRLRIELDVVVEDGLCEISAVGDT
jgi:hypothetical protein